MKLPLIGTSVAGILATGMMFLGNATAFADALDDLRTAVESRTYMIRYEVKSTRESTGRGNRKTGKGKIAGAGIQTMPAMGDAANVGFIVSDGDNFYAEISMFRNPTQCYLRQGEKFYEFYKNQRGKKTNYVQVGSDKAGVVSPRTFTPLDDSYRNGNFELKRALGALFPDAPKNEFEKVYHRAGEGMTEDGLAYFDLKSDDSVESGDGHIDLIRYYFRDGQLAKIAMGRYARAEEDVAGDRTIITVTLYSAVPDKGYLSLPPEVKEGTFKQ